MTALDRVHIVGFCGPKQSGKNTAADFIKSTVLADSENKDFPETYILGMEAFAGPIKSMTAMLLDFYGVAPVTRHDLLAPYIEGELKEEIIPLLGASPRTIMQTLGTGWGREMINQDIWLNSMKIRLHAYEEMRKHGYKGAIVCVTDVRFDNECDMLHELGGKIIEIARPEHLYNPEHASEAGVSRDNIDEVFSNGGTLQELNGVVDNWLWNTHAVPSTVYFTDLDEAVNA